MSFNLKSLKVNKKVLIFGSIALLVIVAVVVALVIGSGGNKNTAEPKDAVTTTKAPEDTTGIPDDETDEVTDTEPAEDTTGVSTDTTDVADESDVATDTDKTTDTDKVTEGDDTTVDPEPVDTQASETDEPSTDVNPNGTVITGEGSASQPYLEIPTEDMTVTTVSVPARSELYYDIYRVGGMWLTIYDSDAFVICDNLQYDAVDGAVCFKVPNALASDAVSFRIGNYGNTAKSFTLIFTNEEGSYSNPVVVESFSDGFWVNLEEGAETGFYFKHYAQQSGVLRLYHWASTDYAFIVTNNRNSAQRTAEADSMTDSEGNSYVEIEVEQGDELLINVGAIPNKRGKYPAIEIWWNGAYN